MEWYYTQDGQQIGPINDSAFRSLQAAGVIRQDTLVWRDGLTEWQTLASLRNIQGVRHYGGFWIRFAARMIDSVILSVAITPLSWMMIIAMVPLGAMNSSPTGESAINPDQAAWPMVMMVSMIALLSLGLTIAYDLWFTVKKGGTPGKLLLSLKIIRTSGEPLSWPRAWGRLGAYILSGLTLYIGYIIAAFDEEKRALHDHICDTRVVRQSAGIY